MTLAIPDSTFRCPDDLTVTPTGVRRVVIVGQCLLAGWPAPLKDAAPGAEADYVLFNNVQELAPQPPRPPEDYDFQLVGGTFTGSDGALYVTFNNYNNPESAGLTADNRNQILMAKSTDGGASFAAPVKVADYYDLPDCPTYQSGKDAGRACVPEKGATSNSYFRATNYSVGSVDPRHPSTVAITVGSYLNPSSNETTGCVPAGFSVYGQDLYTGVKNPAGCTNHILVSVSTNGGASFTGGTVDPRKLPVVGSSAQRRGDQFWQWSTYSPNGALVTSYYDRSYGTDSTTGFSDITVSASSDLSHFGATRATSSSMPPPTAFAGTFYGDYAGLAVTNDTAHPLWSDTRSPELFVCPGTGVVGVPPTVCTAGAANASVSNDEDAFTTSLELPLP